MSEVQYSTTITPEVANLTAHGYCFGINSPEQKQRADFSPYSILGRFYHIMLTADGLQSLTRYNRSYWLLFRKDK